MAVAAAAAPTRNRSSLLVSNGFTAIVVAVLGFVLVMYVLGSGSANLTGTLASIGFTPNAVMLLAYVVGVILYLAVLGFFSYPIRWLLGLPESQETQFYRYGASEGWSKYLRVTYDHKVIGVQYLFAVLLFFCIGGFNAMLIRLELTGSSAHYFSPETYLNLVGEHSVLMLIMASSIIVGPFGNYFIPLMIGAKRMAHPRIEALSFWLFLASGLVLLTAIFYDGFPTGWTGYAPLADQAHLGKDTYIVAFALAGAGGVASAINVLATVLFMRAPGMTWSRLTATIWAIVVASILAWLAFPILIGT